MRAHLIHNQKAQPVQQPFAAVSPPTHEPVLQCKCGGVAFYVTAIDFICTNCAASLKD